MNHYGTTGTTGEMMSGQNAEFDFRCVRRVVVVRRTIGCRRGWAEAFWDDERKQ
jgi:hypothetical protein